MKGPSPHVVYTSVEVYHRGSVAGMRLYQTRQPFSSHRQPSADVSYLSLTALGGLPWTGELPYMLICYYSPYRQDCTGLCAGKLIAVYHNCTVMLGVILWTFDNLLWPKAPNVPHIHLPRAASPNSKSFEDVHIAQLWTVKAPSTHKQVCRNPFTCNVTVKIWVFLLHVVAYVMLRSYVFSCPWVYILPVKPMKPLEGQTRRSEDASVTCEASDNAGLYSPLCVFYMCSS